MSTRERNGPLQDGRSNPATAATEEPARDAVASRVAARRRFLQGAATTGFVAFTVVGRPAWANRCTLSGQLSGNLSIQDPEPCAGEGLSPGYWKTHLDDWHREFPPGMPFYSAFGVNAFPGMSLYQVISLMDEDNGHDNFRNILRQLGFHAVAALQNAASTIRYDLTVAEVQASFREAYYSRDVAQMELTKDSLDRLNNQGGWLA